MKEQKGITLIALIITIIIMLILVGVTINYSLNGGLITKAKEASEQTQVEADKETLMLAALGTIDNNGNINLGQMETPTGFTKTGTGKYTKGGYTYTVNAETGSVTAKKASGDDEVSIAATYKFPYDEDGDGFILILGEEGEFTLRDGDNNNIRSEGSYSYNPETNKITINMVMSGESGQMEANYIATANNQIILATDSGTMCFSTNGFADMLPPDSSLLGTYINTEDNTDQLEVSLSTYGDNDIECGYITDGKESGTSTYFVTVNGLIIPINDDEEIGFTESNGTIILTISGDDYELQPQI